MNKSNVVDWSRLDDWRDLREPGEPDLIAELVASFLQDSELRMARVVVAVQSGDRAVVRREARTVKGTAELLGAGHLRATAERLEAEAARGLVDMLGVAELRAALTEVQSALARGVARC
jgi:HPt (histidine-containing phosphotransfer) domain-containing protein